MTKLRVVLLLAIIATVSVVRAQYARLDSLIKEQPVISQRYEVYLESQKKRLSSCIDDKERFGLLHQIFTDYLAYKYDSAAVYVQKELQLAKAIGDIKLINQSQIDLVHSLSGAALLSQAETELERINVVALTDKQKEIYTRLKIEFYIYQAEFTKGTGYDGPIVDELIKLRREAIQTLDQKSDAYLICKAEVLCDEGKKEEAISILQSQLAQNKSGERSYSILANTIAFYYGLIGNTAKQKEYLILSAQSDIEGSIRENASLCSLATVLLAENDIDRAYRYLQFCINDASFYGTRLRNMQAAALMPAVIDAYNIKQEKTKTSMLVMLIVTSVIAAIMALAVVAFILAFRRNRQNSDKLKDVNIQLTEANDSLTSANDELRATYSKLKEHDLVKEEFLTRFLTLCSQFINDGDAYRKRLLRIQREKAAEALVAELKNGELTDSQVKKFYANFDDAFLKIFPDFSSHVNALLQPEAQMENVANHALTTELRILALLRLGINQNNQIASILNLGISTIYTYRSRMKAKALDHDNFETNIKNILNN